MTIPPSHNSSIQPNPPLIKHPIAMAMDAGGSSSTRFHSRMDRITTPSLRQRHSSLLYSLVFILALSQNLQVMHLVKALKNDNQHRQVLDHSLGLIFNLSNPDPVLNFHNPSSLLSKILIPRPVGSKNLDQCRSLFEKHFQSLSTKIQVPLSSRFYFNAAEPPSYSPEPLTDITTWKLETHLFTDQTPYGIKKFQNQVFTHDPTASRRLVLAAHIDSKFFPNPPESEFVGATDSAVPVALILEIAKALTPLLDKKLARDIQLGKSGMTTERITLQIILLDGEEAFKDWSDTDSIYGARALAKQWSQQLRTPTSTIQNTRSIDQIEMMILYDLIGTKNPKMHNFFKNTSNFFNSFLKVEDRLLKKNLFFKFDSLNLSHLNNNQLLKTANNNYHNSDRNPFFVKGIKGVTSPWGSIADDHLPFLKAGVPILHLISVPFPDEWHTIRDNKEALDLQTILEWNLISQVALIQFLDLEKFLDGFVSGRRDEL